jgi:hypothetical protein
MKAFDDTLWTVAGYKNDKDDLLFEFINPIWLRIVQGITRVAKMLGICSLALDKRFILEVISFTELPNLCQLV